MGTLKSLIKIADTFREGFETGNMLLMINGLCAVVFVGEVSRFEWKRPTRSWFYALGIPISP